MSPIYVEIIEHIPALKDHGELFFYYGVPYSEECRVHDDYTVS